jgi:hypothetical protein
MADATAIVSELMNHVLKTLLVPAFFIIHWSGDSMADDKTAAPAASLDQALKIAEEHDTFRASEFLQSQGEPAAVADLYSRLLRKLYYEKKNVPLMVMLGRSGIDYTLAQARLAQAASPEKAAALKGIAKEIAYNLGANTWPGWKDDGIVISKSDLVAGLDAARLNLSLALELKRNDEALANAHWLLGAHLLAAGKPESAGLSFSEAVTRFRAAGKTQSQLMSSGYVGIAEMMVAPTKEQGSKKLDRAVEDLLKDGSDDARFFAEQLKTASQVFVP